MGLYNLNTCTFYVHYITCEFTRKTCVELSYKSEDSEWKHIKSYSEQLEVYNIPEDIVGEITTEELVKTCPAYPEWRLINAYSNRRIGLANVIGLFNGFHELFKRNDAGKELIKSYLMIDPLSMNPNWTPLQKGSFSFQLTCIEMLLSHDLIINQLSESEINTLLDEAVLKYNNKKQLPHVYSLWDLSPTAGLCLIILQRKGVPWTNDAEVKLFQRTFLTTDIRLLDKIIIESEK